VQRGNGRVSTESEKVMSTLGRPRVLGLPLTVVNSSAAKNNSYSWSGSVNHRDIPCLLKRGAADHEHDQILRSVATCCAFHKWIRTFLESHLQELLEDLPQLRLMLGVYVFYALLLLMKRC